MLAKIIDWSGRNRFLVLLATLFVIVGGIYAVLKTPLDALPDLSDVQVIVYTEYPGQAPRFGNWRWRAPWRGHCHHVCAGGLAGGVPIPCL